MSAFHGDFFEKREIDGINMYIIPSGSEVSTYQPKLATTEKTMDNEFKIYGE